MEYGANCLINIKIHDKYWSVLWDISQMASETPEEYCKNAVEPEIYMGLDNRQDFGELLCYDWRGGRLTEGKKQLSSDQLLALIMVVEKNVDAIKPLLEMANSNPTCDMNDILTFDRIPGKSSEK